MENVHEFTRSVHLGIDGSEMPVVLILIIHDLIFFDILAG